MTFWGIEENVVKKDWVRFNSILGCTELFRSMIELQIQNYRNVILQILEVCMITFELDYVRVIRGISHP